jgi:hypothetical protein
MSWLSKRRRERRNAQLRAIVDQEIELFGTVLSVSIQDECEHQEWDTFVRWFAQPTPDGRRGEHYQACIVCRKPMKIR